MARTLIPLDNTPLNGATAQGISQRKGYPMLLTGVIGDFTNQHYIPAESHAMLIIESSLAAATPSAVTIVAQRDDQSRLGDSVISLPAKPAGLFNVHVVAGPFNSYFFSGREIQVNLASAVVAAGVKLYAVKAAY